MASKPHHWIITLTWPVGTALAVRSAAGVVTPDPGETRSQVFARLLSEQSAKGGYPGVPNVQFFSLEPEALETTDEPERAAA